MMTDQRRVLAWVKRGHRLLALAFFLFLAAPLIADGMPVRAADVNLWQAIKSGGHLVFIRHALAPGTGDPADFTIGDCSTQRNLDDEGRSQARRIGQMFRDRGIDAADVYSSQWCRCVDTARLMNLGAVKEQSFLNSLHGHPQNEEKQKAAFDAWLARQDLKRPVILVTHQATISAFLGVFPASGEMVVVRVNDGNNLSVTGRIPTD